MGHQKPSNKHDITASSSSIQEHDKLALTIRQCGAADHGDVSHGGFYSTSNLMAIQYVSHPVAHNWETTRSTCESCAKEPKINNNPMTAFPKLSCLQNPQVETSLVKVRSDIPQFLRGSETSSSDGTLRQRPDSINQNNLLTTDGFRQEDIYSSSFQNPEMRMNFMTFPSDTAGVYQQIKQAGEGKSTCSARKQNQIIGKSSNDINICAVDYTTSEKIDGSFLTLGIGGKAETRAKTNYGSRVNAFEVGKDHSPQINSSLAQPSVTDFSNLARDFPGAISNFHQSAGLLSHPMGLGDWNMPCNNSWSADGDNGILTATPFQSLQIQQTDKEDDSLMYSNKNSSFLGNADLRSLESDPHKDVQVDQALSLLPFSSSFIQGTHSWLSPGLGLESATPPWMTPPVSDQIQDYHANSARKRPGETSTRSRVLRLRGNSIGNDYIGQLPHANSSTCLHVGNNLSPERIGIENIESNGVEFGRIGPFPKRLGLQYNDGAATRAAEEDVVFRGMGVQPTSNLHQSHNCRPVQLPRGIRGSQYAVDWSQDYFPRQFNGHGPSATGGTCAQNLANRVVLSPSMKVDVLHPASHVPVRSSLKRRANELPVIGPWGHRRKVMSQHINHNSMPHQRHPTPPHVSPHIRCQGFDGPPQPIGEKCLLCKRDLAFTPEGPVYQPTVPPAVAILPCGHAFHDHCLAIITPPDQLKDPPCIPCAIGET